MVNRIRKAMDERDQGFTLIELLVVIIIIGILAAIAIPVFLNQRKKGVDAGLKSDLKNAATQVETWVSDNPQTAVTYAEATSSATTANSPLTGFKASPGNTVRLDAGTGGVGTYVLGAFNSNASTATAAGSCMIYNSNTGGIQASVAACPAPAPAP